MSKVESAVMWAINIAKDDSHGYDQVNRWGTDYDCSSLVISAFQKAGIPVKEKGATYTGNMKKTFENCGFKDVTSKINTSNGGGLVRGDVLLNQAHHTAIYIGNGQIVHASRNENGGATGGKKGDQDGREICTRSYYNYPWDCVLRYTETSTSTTSKTKIKTPIANPTLRKNHKGTQVGYLQMDLNQLGFRGSNLKKLVVDGEFGINTDHAVRQFQKKYGLAIDGIYGVNSRAKMAELIK